MGPVEFSSLSIQWIDSISNVAKEAFVQTGVIVGAAFGFVAFLRTNRLKESHEANALKIDDVSSKSDQALAAANSAVTVASHAAVAATTLPSAAVDDQNVSPEQPGDTS